VVEVGVSLGQGYDGGRGVSRKHPMLAAIAEERGGVSQNERVKEGRW